MAEPMGRRAEVERWALKAAAEVGWAIEGLAGASGGSRAINQIEPGSREKLCLSASDLS